ncbi:MAG: type II secretion system F family protein [Segniliparus sp.]|uniref:type II secretion system F family protein n=1 Tax=Segniliparus sp. TaxID=2804064 RepID=UPI003F39B917
MAALLGACALWIWPSAVATSRVRGLRPRGARRAGRICASRRMGLVASLFEQAWWAPGGVLLLVRPGLGVAVLLVSASARAAWRARRARVREREHAAAVQAALMAVVDELRVGAHPAHAFAAAAAECASTADSGANEAAQTMREVAARARLGGDVGEGLRRRARAARRAGLGAGGALWERLASCWELSHREGVPMAQVLGALRADVVEQIRFGERTDAALAGARSTAKILSALPALCVLLGQAIGAQPLRVLLSGSGSLLLAAGCGFVCAGAAWSRRITAGAGR